MSLNPEPYRQARFAVSTPARGDPSCRADVRPVSAALRNVEDLFFEREVDICHESVWHWWNGFGSMFAGDVLPESWTVLSWKFQL